MRGLPKLLFLLLTILFSGGCGRDDIKVYTIPKEHPAPAEMPAGHPHHAAVSTAPQLKWNLPAGWREGAPSEFRVASFRVKGADGKEADVSFVPLPGTAGGDLGNVNRWRAQVGQPPVTDAELKTVAQSVEFAGQPADLYDQAGEGPTGDPTRILAVIQHRAGTAWFLRMTGDSQFVAEQKPVFIEFLKSVQFATGAAAPVLPDGHPDISSLPASGGQPQWVTPAGWKEVAGGQFLVAKFEIAGGQATVNVSASVGDGGGLVANVNRWRKQLGLGELTGTELAKSAQPLATTSGTAMLVEMSGTDARNGQPAAVIGAMVQQPGQAWFYKLMGDVPVVATQKAAFSQFVREVKY